MGVCEMKDPLSQLLRDADASAPPLSRGAASRIADAVRRRRRREQIRTRVVSMACVVIGVVAVGFTLRPSEPTLPVVQRPIAPPPNPVSLAQLDVDARLAEMTAQHLLAAEARRRAPLPTRIDVQEQSDRTALVLIYEGDGYARGKRAGDAVAAYQRAIELFPKSRWADVARQRLKEFAT